MAQRRMGTSPEGFTHGSEDRLDELTVASQIRAREAEIAARCALLAASRHVAHALLARVRERSTLARQAASFPCGLPFEFMAIW